MGRLRFTAAAFRDLEEITHYIGAQNPLAAAGWADRIEEECWRLVHEPGMGQPRDDLIPGVRFFPVAKYLKMNKEREFVAAERQRHFDQMMAYSRKVGELETKLLQL